MLMKQARQFLKIVEKKTVTLMLCVVFGCVTAVGIPGTSLAAEEEGSPSNEAALGIGSALLTIVYFPAKLVYATLGGIVGGLTYAVTGGDLETAQSVWEPSFYGTYVITPDHLKGNEPVRFYGTSAYEEQPLMSEK